MPKAKTKVRRLTTQHKTRENLPKIPIIDMPGNGNSFAALARLDDDALAGLVEIAIAILDARQGDIDMEQDDHDEDDDPAEAEGAESPMAASHWVERPTAHGMLMIPEHPLNSPLFRRAGK